jgi:hypothetical protein
VSGRQTKRTHRIYNLIFQFPVIGHVARIGERRGIYMVLVGKPKRKRTLGRPRRRWEDNIKMDLQEVGCGGLEWIEVGQDWDRWRALVIAVMNVRIP